MSKLLAAAPRYAQKATEHNNDQHEPVKHAITIFHRVWDDTAFTFLLDSLEQLVPLKELERVEEVTKELKRNRSEAYTMCAFLKDNDSKQSNCKSISGIVVDLDKGHTPRCQDRCRLSLIVFV